MRLLLANDDGVYRIRKTPIAGYDAHRVNGTPADCVALGLDLYKDVETELSGINPGPNLGNGMWLTDEATLELAKSRIPVDQSVVEAARA